MHIERIVTGQQTYEDVVEDDRPLTYNLLNELRDKATAHAAGRILTPEERRQINQFISRNRRLIGYEEPKQVLDTSCWVAISAGDIIERYGRAFPYQAIVMYPKRETRHLSKVLEKYP